jgi:PAS domain S-box-containing protein
MTPADSPRTGDGTVLLRGPRGLSLNAGTRRAYSGAVELPVTRREFDLLRVLLERQGHVTSADDLSVAVWGHQTYGSRNFLDARMSKLRAKLREAGADGVIRTVRGVGYVIEPEEPALTIASDDLFPAVFRSLPRAVIVTGLDGRTLAANRAACELTGYGESHLRSLSRLDLLWSEEDREGFALAFEAALQGEEPRSEERGLVRHDGTSLRVWERSGSIVFGEPVVGVLIELSPCDAEA